MSDPKRKRMKLEELYDLYGDAMYRYLTAVLGSAEDAEDVLQETFCRFTRYSVRWGLVRDRKAFAFRCARNEARRFLERRIADRAGLKAFRPELVSTILKGPDAAAEVRLGEAMAGLPEEQREAVLLKEFEGMTFRAIGSVCGISPHTAASRYRYGMDRLRAFFGEKP
jgi:RNA polymerase sigma-70 factor (ECF subfamily)